MAVVDIVTPVAVIVLAIALVAGAYSAGAALKDRSARKRDDELMREHRRKRD